METKALLWVLRIYIIQDRLFFVFCFINNKWLLEWKWLKYHLVFEYKWPSCFLQCNLLRWCQFFIETWRCLSHGKHSFWSGWLWQGLGLVAASCQCWEIQWPSCVCQWLPLYNGQDSIQGNCFLCWYYRTNSVRFTPHSKKKCCYFHTKINTFWLQFTNMLWCL